MADYLGIFLILAWAANAWALLSVIEARCGVLRQAVWALVLVLPVIGWILWFLLGPRPVRS